MRPDFISVKNVSKSFVVDRSLFGRPLATVHAVDGVSFEIAQGETLGLVGESGCGKSTMGRTLVGLYQPSEGQAYLDGTDIHATLKSSASLSFRHKLQMIFQDPYASLNPRMTVGAIVGEPLIIQHKLTDWSERVDVLLSQVGLSPEHAGRFPHEFSGGQRQRIGIARALASSPDFIVCDEPISALDVSIQAQVVNLLQDLQAQMNLTYLFIAHDLSMVRHISNRIAVMYLGSLVEICPCGELFDKPRHPYTQALLSAIPIPDPVIEARRERTLLTGDVPSPLNPPSGCRFHTRCPVVLPVCKEMRPTLINDNGHGTACHRVHSS